MAGFTIQLDVSQLVSGAQKGQQSIASLGREFKLVAKDASDIAQATQNAGRAATQTGNQFSQLSSKIGEYAKRIAVLYGAYRTLDAVLGTVRRGLDFSASLESSEIAIASVIAATNKLSDATGKMLEGPEKFNAAQELSKGIMDEIQVLALQTTATFDSLADGVAGIVAPATKFGVAMEDLPGFAVKAAQAMTTMKIPVQQMRTEIEALLSGNINKAQDILATNLGITGEMVRNWQKQGVLVEELNKRFEAFAIAGDRVADSWAGLQGNMEDALNYLSGKTGRGIFEGAKQSYRELLALIVNTEPGKIGVGQDIQNIVTMVEDLQSAIGEELISVTRSFIDTVKELNKPENIDKFVSTLDDIYNVTSDIVGHVGAVASAMTSFVSSALSGWNSMPDIVKELGIFGAIILGTKGKLALAAVGVAVDKIGQLLSWLESSGFTTPGMMTRWNSQEEKTQNKPISNAISKQKEEREKREANKDGSKSNINVAPGINGGNKYTDNQIKSAKEKIAQLRFEIEKMNGATASNTLDQKLKQIDEAAKIAGVDAEKLKKEYSEAFRSDTVEAFDKALLKAQGNTREIAAINIAEQAEQWKLKLQDAGLSAEEATAKAKLLAEALGEAAKRQELSEQASILKEIGELTGDVSMTTAAQVQLIEAQAEAYKARLNPEMQKYIDQWEQLKIAQADPAQFLSGEQQIKRLSDTWDDFFKSSMDWGSSLGTTFTGMIDGFSNSFAEMAVNGKASFSDLANSLVADLTRIASKMMMVAMIEQALGWLKSGISIGAGALGSGNFSIGSGGTSGSMALSSDFHAATSLANGVTFHTGGIVGVGSGSGNRLMPLSIYDSAPRFHSGKLPWNPATELPAVIRKDEGVFTPDQMKALGSPKVNLIINNNASGVEVETEQYANSDGSIDIEATIIDAVNRDMNRRGGTINRSMRNVWGNHVRTKRYY